MSGLQDLPEHIVRFIESGVVAEFATVSAAGAPLDTPTYYFPSDDMKTIDLATGLQNPAKAERARRNPKVGLLIEGAPEEPVVAVRGHAAVRDSDLEANIVRYVAETGFKGISYGLPWSESRSAVTYWTRIIIEITPLRVLWWDRKDAMDEPPHVWTAPRAVALPVSDPRPPGKTSPSPWPTRPWRELAEEALTREAMPPHLAVLDEDGYPMPMLARSWALVDEGFRLELPKGTPWSLTGRANVTFGGFNNFLGEAVARDGAILFKVERGLPQTPAAKTTREVIMPRPETRAKQMARLMTELERRGRGIPHVPEEAPAPTRLHAVRQARIAGGAPVTGVTAEMRGLMTKSDD